MAKKGKKKMGMVAGGLFPNEAWANYFASGSNHEGEILGLEWNGRHIGVSVNALDKSGHALAALKELAGSPTMVFVDSGAFGEVEKSYPFKVKKPITHEEWNERISVYWELATVLKGQLFVVAPDRVGCQETTLERLKTWADDMRWLHEEGAHVIVPIQKGEMSAIEFDRAARDILGFEFVRGIPSKKSATTPEELSEFCNELWEDPAVQKPVRMHLLGMAPNNAKYAAMATAVMLNLPGTQSMPMLPLTTQPTLTCDSVRILALAVKGRPITETRKKVLAEAAALGEELTTTEAKHRTVFRVFHEESKRLTKEAEALGWTAQMAETARKVWKVLLGYEGC